MDGLDNPVNARITADGLVLRVDKDYLEILIGRVLIDPVGIENPQIGAAAAHAFFGGGFERALVLQLVDTLVGRFALMVSHISVLPKEWTSHGN